MRKISVALIGQPNVGKSTLFNILTHGHVIVTNWPGTTVEKHEGRVYHGGYEISLVDLPGVYSLTGLTIEEKISRDFILRNRPDVVIVLVESLSLERTLYLAVEVLELMGNVVIAVTKVDEAHSKGIHINHEILEKSLRVPVIPISAIKNLGISELLDKAVSIVDSAKKPLVVDYGELELFIDAIASILQELGPEFRYPVRWSAIKILEGDEDLISELRSLDINICRRIEEIVSEAKRRFGQDLAAYVSRKRFEFINTVSRGAIARLSIRREPGERFTWVLYNPYLAPIASIAILGSVFVAIFTINTGYPLTLLLEKLGLSNAATWLEEHNLGALVERFIDAVVNTIYDTWGVTIVTQFVVEALLRGVFILVLLIPLITVVLVVLGVFEDSGLLTRMAVGIHSLLQKIGFSGHSVFSFSLCLGCNVPGLLATRANPNVLERLRLLMLTPFIPCQARLVVILTIASAIGGIVGAVLVPLTYILSFGVVVLLNLLLHTIDKKRGKEYTAELLLTLPPIHRPIPKVVWWFTWFYLKHFIVKIGTIIVITNAVLWLLSNVNANLVFVDNPSESIIASVSRYLSPLLRPLGVSGRYSWIMVLALLVGFIAKELFIVVLLSVTGTESVREALELIGLSIPSAVAITVFVTLYVPCLATLSTVYAESKSIKLAIATALLMIATAYVLSIIVYTTLNLVT